MASSKENIENELQKEKEKSAADDLMLFVDSLNRAAVSILEEWKYGIEDSHRLHEKNEINASVEIIESLLQRLKEPKCNLDEQLSLTIKSIICDLPDFFHLVRNRDQISSQNRRKEKVHKYLMKNSKNEEYIFIKLISRSNSNSYIDIVISKSIIVNVRKEFIVDWNDETPKKSRIRKFCDIKL